MFVHVRFQVANNGDDDYSKIKWQHKYYFGWSHFVLLIFVLFLDIVNKTKQ